MRKRRWEEVKGQIAQSQIYRLTESFQQPARCVVHQSCLASSCLIPENWSVLERTLDWALGEPGLQHIFIHFYLKFL